MTVKESVKKGLLISLLGAMVVTTIGCESLTSQALTNDATATEKETVLKEVAISLNAQENKETMFIEDECAHESDDSNTWNVVDTIDLGTSQKESYDFGYQDFDGTSDVVVNASSDITATFNTWEYEIEDGSSDVYELNEYDGYTATIHYLQTTTSNYSGYYQVDVSNYNATMAFNTGTELIVTSGTSTFRSQDYVVTLSANYPFTLNYDLDEDGVKERYSGTLTATSINVDDTSDYMSATVANEDGFTYGQVIIYNDGCANVVVSD